MLFHKISQKKFKSTAILLQIAFFFNLLFSGCARRETSPTELVKVEAFLNDFLFHEGGAYTLLGDKPMTSILVFIGSENDILPLSEFSPEMLEQTEFVEDNTKENLEAWKRFSKKLKLKNFCFGEHICSLDNSHSEYFLVNIEKLKKVFQKYQNQITEATHMSISFEQAIQELQNSKSVFWDRLLSNHYLAGIFYGYGEENCMYFQNEKGNKTFSKTVTSDFPLPTFACQNPENNPTSVKYFSQKEEIQQLFKDKSFLEVVLKKLQKK